jgi:hypothetical protein
MSTFPRVTKHPITGKYEKAMWIDDYFGQHIYGVQFQSDDKVWPTELVDNNEPKNFWVEDVKVAFLDYLKNTGCKAFHDPEVELTKFLNFIQYAYKERWADDPIGGRGATLDDCEDSHDFIFGEN